MTFWSSQKLERTDHPDKKMVDCNALTVRVGPEVYVTPVSNRPRQAPTLGRCSERGPRSDEDPAGGNSHFC